MPSLRQFIAMVTLVLCAAFSARAQYASLGHANLSFYEASAAVVQHVLERQGFNVAVSSGSHAAIFPKVAAGDVDLFVAAWLPYAHKGYWDEYKDDLVQIGVLFEDARLYWAVPDYVSANVRSVADLKRPEVAARMVKTIRGTLPDSGLMIGSRKIFEHYGLGEAGYELAPGPAKEWLTNFDARIAANEWFVMPLWRPQYLNRAHKLRILEEPQEFFGGDNTAWLVANKAWAAKLPRKTRELLGRIELNVKAVTQMDYWMNVEKMDARAAARRWIANNPETVGWWLRGPEDN
jgi:glycine betaine/proline transport system substrate-binding protein